eukprot:1644575-Rhodomonas_salina.2
MLVRGLAAGVAGAWLGLVLVFVWRCPRLAAARVPQVSPQPPSLALADPRIAALRRLFSSCMHAS